MKTVQTTVYSTFIFLLIAGTARAQVPELIKNEQFRVDAQAAVDSLYNFNPEGAQKRLASWKEQYPSHPLWQLMEGMEFWWILLSDLNDRSRDEYFYKLMKKADYAAAKLLYDQPGHADALIIRTVANGYVARQHSNRDEWTASLNAARKAYSAYGYLQDAMPELADLKLAEGLKLYYSAYLPEAYPVVKTVSWFLPEGDKAVGLQRLREASESAIFARAEAAYFLGNINYNYEKEYQKALGYFRELYKTYPNNNYYVRLYVQNLFKTGHFDDAATVIDDALRRWSEDELAFAEVLREELLFWKGRLMLRNRDYVAALAFFKKSLAKGSDLPRTSHRGYHTAAAYFAGVAAAGSGNRQAAIKYYQLVLDAKTDGRYKTMAKDNLGLMRS